MKPDDRYHGPDRRRRRDLFGDVRGVLGAMAMAGLFGIVFVQLGYGKAITIPPEVAGIVGSVIGFYFGGKGGSDSDHPG